MRYTGMMGMLLLVIGGCGGDARVELSAADAILGVAGQMDRTLDEYHQEVERFDDAREGQLVSAFITRVRSDAASETAMDEHASEFTTALARVRANRRTEWSRRTASADNVGVLREIAQGLRRIGIESLSLQDEARRYLEGWIQARERSATPVAAAAPAPR